MTVSGLPRIQYGSDLQELSDHPSNSILDLVLHGKMCMEKANVLEGGSRNMTILCFFKK
jgi:hypothetical protein